ncbi:unnamed protein product [Linum trigynum]|uniref:Uncharacterized protein n=1 Tax=Linum trigynum TaxID=586398 RepID=A0AAV2DX06_9ROSI
MKSSLDTCIKNYDKAIASLDAVKEACKACDKDKDANKDKKCSPKHVSKELNDAIVEGTNILLEVAKKIK